VIDSHVDSTSNSRQEVTTKESTKSEVSYDQKLRTMSTSELIQELVTLKWHYALFKENKKYDMICAVELEIARRKGSLKPSINNGVER
jgi:hypothetical protein